MPTHYSTTQIVLHWVVAVLVGLQFLFAEGMEEAFEGVEEGAGAYASAEEDREADEVGEEDDDDEAAAGGVLTAGAALHIGTGLVILSLALFRLVVRSHRGAPPAPESDPVWQKRLSRAVHWTLYTLLILIPLAGAVAWFNRAEGAAEVHEALGKLLLALVVLHIAGGIYGQFVQKTGVLERMYRPGD